MDIVDKSGNNREKFLTELYNYKIKLDTQLVLLRSNFCRQPMERSNIIELQKGINQYYSLLNKLADSKSVDPHKAADSLKRIPVLFKNIYDGSVSGMSQEINNDCSVCIEKIQKYTDLIVEGLCPIK